jgi:hypothetical protein
MSTTTTDAQLKQNLLVTQLIIYFTESGIFHYGMRAVTCLGYDLVNVR